jgi:hypothetical protein
MCMSWRQFSLLLPQHSTGGKSPIPSDDGWLAEPSSVRHQQFLADGEKRTGTLLRQVMSGTADQFERHMFPQTDYQQVSAIALRRLHDALENR